MKNSCFAFLFLALLACNNNQAPDAGGGTVASRRSAAHAAAQSRHLYIDVHDLGPGKAPFHEVMAAHRKDLAVEGKHDVHFIKFFVDEKNGKVYCLSDAPDAHSIYATHQEAHGLLPSRIWQVSEGEEAALRGGSLYLDIHRLAPGSVTPEAVAKAHQKDLSVEAKYGVHFVNYWLDENAGVILCLSEAPDSTAIINTHREAHGLLPAVVMKVQEGD